MIRILAILAVPALAGLGTSQDAQPPAAAKRPNILFLFADDQRPDTVGAFGNEHIETPHLDSLVRGGFRFTNNYCMGSWHGAVCVPSRAMLMSGRTLHRVKPDLRGVHTLPQALADAGYLTYGTGKWHNQRPAFERSFRFGRNIFFGGMCDHTEVPLVDMDPETRKFSKRRTGAKFSSESFADAAVGFLQAHRSGESGQPFFLYVAFTAPHDPRNPPLAYRERYARKLPPLPRNFRPQVEWFADQSWGSVRDEVLAAWPREPAVIRSQLAEYYGLITHMDDQIGRILAALRQTDQADNTIIVYAADHGLALGSHGLVGKQNVFEHSMGCPLVICGPGIPKGKSSPALTYLFDLYPTLCKLAGAKVGAEVEGSDLLGVIRGERASVRDSLFTVYRHTQLAVRDSRFKLVRFPEIDKTLLFDLQRDPDEMVDLSGAQDQAGRVTRMTATLAAWQEKVGDRTPRTVAAPRPQKVDLTGRKRRPDRWQPRWIREKYFGEGAK